MKELKLNQLNKDQFQPFGDIIDKKQEIPFEINNGNCLRYNNLAKLSFTDGKAGISLFESKKITFPYSFNFMEKHPLGSQAFIPIFGCTRYSCTNPIILNFKFRIMSGII